MLSVITWLVRLLLVSVAIGSLPVAALAAEQLEISNTANAKFAEALTSEVTREQQSNTVAATVTIHPPQIAFYRDATFTKKVFAAKSGTALYVRASAPGCAHDLNQIETLYVTVTQRSKRLRTRRCSTSKRRS
jgi:hypothetical protein